MKLYLSALNLLALAVLAVCAVGPFLSTAHAADGKDTAAPAAAVKHPEAAKPAAQPALTDTEKLAISKANNDLLQDALQANDLQAKWAELQKSIAADRSKAEQLFNAALTAHGLKPGEWTLDKDLALQKAAAAVPAIPAPPAK